MEVEWHYDARYTSWHIYTDYALNQYTKKNTQLGLSLHILINMCINIQRILQIVVREKWNVWISLFHRGVQ